MDHRIDTPADGDSSASGPHRNGTAASAARKTSELAAIVEPDPTPEAITLASGDGDSEWVAQILRASAFGIMAFQIGYTVLDGGEYQQTFARTLPLHIAGMSLCLVALLSTLSRHVMRNWRAITLAVCTSILANTTWIAMLDGDRQPLVASIVLLLFGAGALIPWNPRWQASLEAAAMLAWLGYSIDSADSSSKLAISSMLVLGAALLSQLSAVHINRYRKKLAAQLSALSESHRLLSGEMEQREQLTRARELDHSRWQQSESMLRKVFEASPENIAINSLVDGRFIAVNDEYQVAGYTRDDVLAGNVIALDMWKHQPDLERFLDTIRQTGRVRNMEIVQRRKDGAAETYLVSASVVEVDGEPCAISMTRDITETKRIETRLRASHATLHKILQATLDVIVVSRASDGAYIDFNQEFGLTGYTLQDLNDSRAGSCRIFKHPEQQKALRDLVLAKGVARNVEVEFLTTQGVTTPTMLSALRVELDGEDCIVTLIRDLTAAKEASRKLEESAQTVRDIFDVSPDAISVTRVSDGKYVAFNEEFLRLGGYTREQAMGSSDLELAVWTDPEDRVRMTEALAHDDMVRNLEIEFQTRSRTSVSTLISASMINLGSEPCVVTYIRDITEIKRTERDLRSAREEMSRHVKALSLSEETFRKLFDANLDSMTLTGPDGKLTNVNREFVRSTGFSHEESIGRHFSDLNQWIHPDEMIAFAKGMGRHNQVRNIEVALRNKDGSEHPTLISATLLELDGQRCCLTVSRDIADTKMTQRELVAAREAALAASRAKSEFLSSMSHEIRTPMNAILGMADLLAETELGDEQRRYVNTVLSNGNALLALINSILDLAKVESGRLNLEAVEFDPREVTEKALETLALRAHEKGLELMARFAPGVPDLAIGDPLRLGQILINLVGNAIKFTEHGQVLVSVQPDPNSTVPGDGLRFAVTDTGIGIPGDKIHLLFNPFTQADSSTSRKYGGSGLGLAIVARLVALMKGKVEVASEPGKGSSFWFTAQLGTASGKPAPSEEPKFRDLAILLVDDNQDCGAIVAGLLSVDGANVTQVSSATLAIAELRRADSKGSPFQIILLDGRMPSMSGFALAQQLMSAPAGRPQLVMMLGTDDLTLTVARLRALGVDNYVVKPVRRADLFRAISRARETVCLEPRIKALASPALAPPSSASTTLARPLHILIVDDSQDNRALIEAYLKKTPYRLEVAEDGQQAIDKFVAGRFDLVLMDIQMPIVDGYEATRTIRAWERDHGRRRTPVVALTASALEDAADRTMAAGCDAHVTKPVSKATLLNAIRDAVAETPSADGDADLIDLKEELCRTE